MLGVFDLVKEINPRTGLGEGVLYIVIEVKPGSPTLTELRQQMQAIKLQKWLPEEKLNSGLLKRFALEEINRLSWMQLLSQMIKPHLVEFARSVGELCRLILTLLDTVIAAPSALILSRSII